MARLAVFPVIVKGQREAAKLNNVLPEMTKLTTRMTEAKQSGNKFECKFSLSVSSLNLSLQSQYGCVCVRMHTHMFMCVQSEQLVMALVFMLQLPKPTLT